MPPTIEQLQARHRHLEEQARVNAEGTAALATAVDVNTRRIDAFMGHGCALDIHECRVLVDYLDGCLIAEDHQPSAITAIRDRALAAMRRADRPDKPEDTL